MSQVKESPVKRFPGTITLPDFLNHPQAIAYWRGVQAARALPKDTATMMDVNYALLPGLCACVEKWDIIGLPTPVTADTFPATPVRDCRLLISWVDREIATLIKETEDIPNG